MEEDKLTKKMNYLSCRQIMENYSLVSSRTLETSRV